LIFVVHVCLPRLTETTLALVSLAVNKRLFVMHRREIFPGRVGVSIGHDVAS
jgi:hypothetical protein